MPMRTAGSDRPRPQAPPFDLLEPLAMEAPGSAGPGGAQSVDPHDLTALTERHEVDEFFLRVADEADASFRSAWFETDVHVCAFDGCCEVRR